jgi:hypothetical protein
MLNLTDYVQSYMSYVTEVGDLAENFRREHRMASFSKSIGIVRSSAENRVADRCIDIIEALEQRSRGAHTHFEVTPEVVREFMDFYLTTVRNAWNADDGLVRTLCNKTLPVAIPPRCSAAG